MPGRPVAHVELRVVNVLRAGPLAGRLEAAVALALVGDIVQVLADEASMGRVHGIRAAGRRNEGEERQRHAKDTALTHPVRVRTLVTSCHSSYSRGLA